MATGVPLVTFKVGQAIDLVKHGKNGWLAEIEETEQLAHYAEYVINNTSIINNIKDNARKTAKENSYNSQIPLWQNFMHGFIDE